MKGIVPGKIIVQRTVWLFLSGGLLNGCAGENKDQETEQSEATQQVLSIDTFTKFPTEIDGCASYYSGSTAAFNAKKYIYADNMGDQAFMMINGIMTKFTLSKSDTVDDRRSTQIWVNEKYELIIDVKTVKQIDEVLQQEGVLKLKPKKGKEVIKNIFGECGC